MANTTLVQAIFDRQLQIDDLFPGRAFAIGNWHSAIENLQLQFCPHRSILDVTVQCEAQPLADRPHLSILGQDI